MLSDAMLQKKFQISKDDATWGFAFKQLAIQNNIKIDEIECYDAFQCSFNYFDLQGNALVCFYVLKKACLLYQRQAPKCQSLLL